MNLEDKELLILAAKAAGYTRRWDNEVDTAFWYDEEGRVLTHDHGKN